MRHIVLILITFLFVQPAIAAGQLDEPFDASVLDAGEKRLLQAGMALKGTYDARLDGAWGNGSQGALNATTRAMGGRGAPTWGDVAQLTRDTVKRLRDENWSVVKGPDDLATFLLPLALMAEPGNEPHVYRNTDGTLRVRSMSSDRARALVLHATMRNRADERAPIYTLDRGSFQVSSGKLMDDRTSIYLRSDQVNGRAASTLVEFTAPASDAARLLIASIQLGQQPKLSLGRGKLRAALKALNGQDNATEDMAEQPKGELTDIDQGRIDWIFKRNLPDEDNSPDEEDQPRESKRAGIGFYVNNTDFVVPVSIVNRCGDAGLMLLDGTPARRLRGGGALGLAILTSARRSDYWLPLGAGTIGRQTPDLRVLGVSKKGWATGAPADIQVQMMGELAGGPGKLRYVAALPARKRNTGAPILDAQGKVIGVAIGALDVPGLSAAQIKALRKVSVLVSAQELPNVLTRNAVAFQRSGPAPSLRKADPGKALVPLMCQ